MEVQSTQQAGRRFILRVPEMGLFFLAVELPDPEAGQASYVIASEPLFALSIVLALTLETVTTALTWTYHVAYYRLIHSDDVHAAMTSEPSTDGDMSK